MDESVFVVRIRDERRWEEEDIEKALNDYARRSERTSELPFRPALTVIRLWNRWKQSA